MLRLLGASPEGKQPAEDHHEHDVGVATTGDLYRLRVGLVVVLSTRHLNQGVLQGNLVLVGAQEEIHQEGEMTIVGTKKIM